MSTELNLGGVPIHEASQRPRRITGLFWGPAGAGKTTLACTAPGRKLLVNFDPDGDASIGYRDDVDVADFVGLPHTVAEKFKSSDPLGLESLLKDGRYGTVIVDSLTNVSAKALARGVATSNGATVERPSQQAYQIRNNLTLQLVKNVLAITAKYNTHVIFIAHENQPVTNDDGVVLFITLSLGGQLPEQAAVDFSEVWNISDLGTGRGRRIAVRPVRQRKPMKTRMFITSGEPEFMLTYDADEDTGDTIEGWYDAWVAGGCKKLPLPVQAKKK